jgi:hypothetical protein
MSAWITGGAMVLSTIGSGIAANKAAKAQDKAMAANQAANDEANRVAWVNYLMSRGIKPKGNVQPGEIPTDYEAINSRLPLWANLTIPNPKGPNALLPRTPAVAAMGAQPASPAEPPRFAVPTLRRV